MVAAKTCVEYPSADVLFLRRRPSTGVRRRAWVARVVIQRYVSGFSGAATSCTFVPGGAGEDFDRGG